MKCFRLDKCHLPSTDIKGNDWIRMSGIIRKKQINQFIFDILEVFIWGFIFSKAIDSNLVFIYLNFIYDTQNIYCSMSQNSHTPSHSYNFFCDYQPQFIIHYHNKHQKHTLSNALLKYFITIKLITYLTVLTFLRETQLLIDPFFANISLFVYQTVWSSKKADSKVTCWRHCALNITVN